MKKIALVVAGLMTTACGIENNNAAVKTSAATKIHKVLTGVHSDSLFNAMENAGIKPQRAGGRIIVGAINLVAENASCRVVMNASQETECHFIENGEQREVKDAGLAKKAAKALDAAGAHTMHAIYGVNNYEATDMTCTRGVGPLALTRCEFNIPKHDDGDDSTLERKISGDQAKSLHAALESTGISAETVDGRPIAGAVTLKADALRCQQRYDANLSKNCEAEKKGLRLKPIDSELLEALVAMLEEQGAQVNPRLVGASNYAIKKISCQMTVLAEPVYECSFGLIK
jgi:hypothetical protein